MPIARHFDRWSVFKYTLIALFVVAFVAVGAVAIGKVYAFGQKRPQSEPFWTLVIGKLKAKVLPSGLRSAEVITRRLSSIFVDLHTEGKFVQVSREGNGGGLTPYEDGVLLLTHEGQVFFSDSAQNVYLTDIKTPENGFQAYEAASRQEKYLDYQHRLDRFRYNDILFFENDQSRLLAVSFTEFHESAECYTTTVATLGLPDSVKGLSAFSAEPGEWQIIFRTEPCLPLKKEFNALEGQMAGGKLAFKEPYSIVLTSGDYHWDGVYAPEALAHLPDNDYGKVIVIDVRDRSATQLSRGLRNMQGIAVDPQGRIWTVEHGPRGGDELNLIVEGSNYGWPFETYGTEYDGEPWPLAKDMGRHELYRPPVFAWLPSVATSGMTLIEGFHNAWDGDLLVSSFKGDLFRTRIRGERVVFTERIGTGWRMRAVKQLDDGRIAIWTDEKLLVFLQAVARDSTAKLISDWIDGANLPETSKQRLATVVASCNECHSFREGDHTGAPSLAKVYGSDIASSMYEYYSSALLGVRGKWTEERLAKFISNPQAFAPGTTMPASTEVDEETVSNLVRLLKDIEAQ